MHKRFDWNIRQGSMGRGMTRFGNLLCQLASVINASHTRASRPRRKQKSAFSTRAMLCISEFLATTPRIIATELRREVSQESEDYFEILIDSNHDRRDACVFQVNPLGTQSDSIIVGEQSNSEEIDFDSDWDGVWSSVWGLNFKRFI
jgi:hypothetical protein